MLVRQTLRHVRDNVVAYLALFLSLGGATAYAANTIRTGDIVDNEVLTTDVRDDTLGFGGLFHQDLGPGSVRGSEIQNFSIGNGELITGSVDSLAVTQESLTGADIDESSLSIPAPITRAAFVGFGGGVLLNDVYKRVASRRLAPGSYALRATANLRIFGRPEGFANFDPQCELRDGADYIGGAVDRRTTYSTPTKASLTMNGGANVSFEEPGDVGLFCRIEDGPLTTGAAPAGQTEYGQMMIVRLDGFF